MTLAPADTWPDFRFVLRPLPWTWKLRPWLYVDDIDGWRGHWSFHWLFLTIEWWAESKVRYWFMEAE